MSNDDISKRASTTYINCSPLSTKKNHTISIHTCQNVCKTFPVNIIQNTCSTITGYCKGSKHKLAEKGQ